MHKAGWQCIWVRDSERLNATERERINLTDNTQPHATNAHRMKTLSFHKTGWHQFRIPISDLSKCHFTISLRHYRWTKTENQKQQSNSQQIKNQIKKKKTPSESWFLFSYFIKCFRAKESVLLLFGFDKQNHHHPKYALHTFMPVLLSVYLFLFVIVYMFGYIYNIYITRGNNIIATWIEIVWASKRNTIWNALIYFIVYIYPHHIHKIRTNSNRMEHLNWYTISMRVLPINVCIYLVSSFLLQINSRQTKKYITHLHTILIKNIHRQTEAHQFTDNLVMI